jgi:predicted amidohydrolase
MKIAICQTKIIWEEKQQNRAIARTYIRQAKESNADVVFFPEMSFTGFSMNIEKTAEDDFFTLQALKEDAHQYNLALGAGWVKKNGTKAENHYSVVGTNHETILEYTQIHSFSYASEDPFFIGGDQIHHGEIEGMRFAVFICCDLRFPELFRLIDPLTSLVVIPANWPHSSSSHWCKLLQARAIENQIFIAGVNCTGDIGGQYYSGNSCIIDPNGEIVTMINNEEGMLIGDIPKDLTDYCNAIPL